MFFVNGIAQDLLHVSDRATLFGDGCFTTARIINSRISLIDAHIDRLQKTCAALMIPFTTWGVLRLEIEQLALEYTEGVLKIIISRGSGGSGYSATNCLQPTRIISVSVYPSHYILWRREGIMLVLSPIRLGRNAVLAGFKHLNRLEQVLIRMHLDQTGADEALVLDSEGYITECSTANLFWRCGKEVFTPQLNYAGVNGLMRLFCLLLLAHSNFLIHEVNTGVKSLCDAEEVIICNTLLPVVPVCAYDNHHWPIGELFQFLAPLCEQI